MRRALCFWWGETKPVFSSGIMCGIWGGKCSVGPFHPSLPGPWGLLSAGLVLLWDGSDTEPIPICFHLTAPRQPENTKHDCQRPEPPNFPIVSALELHTRLECDALNHIASRRRTPRRNGTEGGAED